MMQRSLFGLIVVAAGLGLVAVACSDEPDPQNRRNTPDSANPGASSGTPGSSGASGAAAVVCPGDVAAPVQLGTEPEASDLRIVGDTVFFRVGTKLVRVKKDGTGRADVYESKDLVRTFTDGTTMVLVESPNPPNAVIRVGAVGGNPDELTQIGTDLVAGGVVVFASDATSIYAVAEQGNGDVIYKVAKEGGGELGEITNTEGVVSDAQLVAGTVWYVKDQKEIYKLPLGGEGEVKPTLVFTAENGCSLAVGTAHLYCTTGGVLEQRDLAGANPKKLFDDKTSKVPAAFGPGLASGDGVVVRSSGGASGLKSVLRSVGAGGEERVIACGREAIGSLAVDGTSAAWVETGKGVFFAK